MRHDEFIGQVQHHARLSSRGDAERATRAMLETLAERLAGNEPFDLAAQLPREIGHYLQHDGAGKGEHLSLDEFFKRVSIREGVDLPDAVFHARAVASVLVDAVSPGEMRDALAQLPEEYNRLFAGSEGAMARDLRRPHLG